jgi:predicted nuclease of predicted toxin-antitoxin system
VKLLLDMNLTPRWVGFLQSREVEAVHWSSVGDPRAKDAIIMAWARARGYVLFTHDLDFSALLAMTHAAGPSVLQVRTQDVLPEAIGDHVLQVLRTHEDALEQGAVVTIDETTARVRILPIGRAEGK